MPTKQTVALFDLDGTLVDSRKDIVAATNAALAAVGHEPQSFETIAGMIGKPLDAMFHALLHTTDEELLHRARDAYRPFYFEHCADESRLYPGVLETLRLLHSTCRMAIATTKKTYMAVRVAELFSLAEFLDHVQGTEDFPPKPEPDVIFHALAALGASADHAVMVGDTTGDILAARAAKIPCVAVSYGIGGKEELAAAKPAFVIDRMEDLPACLKALGLPGI